MNSINTAIVSSSASFDLDNGMFVVNGSYSTGYEYDKDIFFMLGLELDKDFCLVGDAYSIDFVPCNTSKVLDGKKGIKALSNPHYNWDNLVVSKYDDIKIKTFVNSLNNLGYMTR